MIAVLHVFNQSIFVLAWISGIVDTFNIYHIDLSIAERTITTVKIDVFASSVCLDSTNNNMIYGGNDMHLTSLDLTNPSSPVSSILLTSLPSGKRVQGACVVTSDRFVIFTDLTNIYEYSFSLGQIYRTISNLGAYSGDARIYALTVTGDSDNIILYSSNHKIWKLNRVQDVNPVLVAGSYEGSLDGAYNVAQFVHPSALTMSVDHKTIYLNTEKNIRAIDYDTGTVSTVAGALVSSTTGDDGCTDGARNEATFFFNTAGLGGMTLSADGAYLLVPGWACHNVRRVNLVTQITSHCKACAAGTYKDVLGPQACEPCASCPAGQYRVNCTASNPGSCVDCSSCPQGQIISGCEGQSAGECRECGWEQQFKPGDVVAVKISSEVCMPGYYLTQCMYTFDSQYSDLTSQHDLESITGSNDRGFWIFTVSDSFLHTDNTFRYTMIRNSNSATVTWLHDGYQNDVLCLNGRVAEFPSGACGLSDCH